MTTDADPGGTWVPRACTLPTAEQPLRAAEFDALFRTALLAVEHPEPGRLRLLLDGAAEVEATARDLAQRETRCCSFFTFDFARTGKHHLRLDVAVPAGQLEVLRALESRATAGLANGLADGVADGVADGRP